MGTIYVRTMMDSAISTENSFGTNIRGSIYTSSFIRTSIQFYLILLEAAEVIKHRLRKCYMQHLCPFKTWQVR
jgi:hypothetical protein